MLINLNSSKSTKTKLDTHTQHTFNLLYWLKGIQDVTLVWKFHACCASNESNSFSTTGIKQMV